MPDLPLILPLPPLATQSTGIFQGDIVVRTSLEMALADMRANPWLLDFAFASLVQDAQTLAKYGEKTRKQAKDWFLKTDVKVISAPLTAESAPHPVCVVVALVKSSELENTLGDVHYQPSEDLESSQPALTPTFTPASYDALTGTLRLPANVAAGYAFSAAMAVVDKVGVSHQVVDVPDYGVLSLAPGTVADFDGCYVRSSLSTLVSGVESATFRQTYAVQCNAVGESEHLTFLHSVVLFALLRYRRILLEPRGFERTQVESQEPVGYRAEGQPMWFQQNVTLSGVVRQAWPAAVGPRVLVAEGMALAEGADPTVTLDAAQSDWGEADPLSGRIG